MNELALRSITGSILALVLGVSYLFLPTWVLSVILGIALILILIIEWPPLNEWLLTPLYPILPFALAMMLNHSQLYRPLLVFTLVMTMCHDMGGYIGGNLWGKTPLLPKVSPKKTWEGFAFGVALSVICSFLVARPLGITMHSLPLLGVVIVGNFVAVAGDLFESTLKRRACIKDSSNLLPGHGGLLDRCDSLMFTIPYVFILRQLLIK